MRTGWIYVLAAGAALGAVTLAGPSRAVVSNAVVSKASTSKRIAPAPPPATAFGGRPSGWTVMADPARDAPPSGGDAQAVVQVATGDENLATTAASAVVSLDALDEPSLGNGYAILLGDGAGARAGGDALTCLTQAVYFEARGEPVEGQEAVAQVVMNRTRLPQYPKQVCEVVFQGADRPTGCQFSFTCNGALGAPTELEAWRRANEVAGRALAGFVYAPVKDATHFHASWVNPYWSGSLTRLGQIGGHVFYH